MSKKLSAKEHAVIFREVFFDQYEDEENFTPSKVKAMTKQEALAFVRAHIHNMIAINGASELWECERKAAADLKIDIT
ncbi:MAG: hypothetical protein LLG40_13885 [Deltaproteobacteria bacterium]|nr:hypothetical protein [Deltaproteobacteria bacterium]